MKRLAFLIWVAVLGGVFATGSHERILKEFRAKIPSSQNLLSIVDRLKSAAQKGSAGGPDLPRTGQLPVKSQKWTFADGTTLDAVLVAADYKSAQLRVPESHGVGQIGMDLLAEPDRLRIRSWVEKEGVNGVAGFPLPLKNHRWPQQWRESGPVALKQVGNTAQWKSQHFDINNVAGVKREALESITLICESVDGALNSLPLPLPVNWGRDPKELRKIVIEKNAETGSDTVRAGYWDGRTGMVHIYADCLLEPDLQLVVFEFDKPEKVQKYDVIVHEVTHQSMAAMLYLGIPAWVPEGIAEYLAATQFAPAYYEFVNTHTSIRHHINKRLVADRIVKERKMHFAHLENLMGRGLLEWNQYGESDDVAGALQYHESLVLIDYFFHRDHPHGVHFRRYLECVLSGVPEPEARGIHLLRGRSYQAIEAEIIELWKPLGFAINFQDRSELREGDITIDWAAEDVKRTIASQRATAAAAK